jgi:hypothetical protein
MPRLNPSCDFVFEEYEKVIATVFVNDGFHSGALTADQHAALRHSLTAATFQFIFLALPVRDALFLMFLAGLDLRKGAKKEAPGARLTLFAHVREQAFQNCGWEANDASSGDPVDVLAIANVIHIFTFFDRFLAQQFGAECTPFLPHFTIEAVITNSASVPSIVLAEPAVNPTSLIQHFIGLRCKHENLDSISLCDDVDLVKSTHKVISTAMNRGNWVILHYARPSRYAASMLADVFTQMTTSVNTNFRLIIIASSLECLPRSMLARSKRVNIETFPNVRNLMLELFHHSVSIRSTTNSRAMKKLACACCSRSSASGALEPVGFSSDVRPSDLIFRDVIDQLQLIIDTNPNDIALGNLRLQLQRVVWSGVADSVVDACSTSRRT